MSKRIKVSARRNDAVISMARAQRMKIEQIFWAAAAWLRVRGERVKNFTVRNWIKQYAHRRRIHPKVSQYIQHVGAQAA